MLPYIVALILLLAGVVLALVTPEFWLFNTLLVISSFIIILIKERKKICRRKKYISEILTIILTLAVIGVSSFLVKKYSMDIDLTRGKIHSLSDKSLQVMSKVDSKLELTLFAKRENWNKYLNLMKLYRRSSHHVFLNAIDPLDKPLLVQSNEIKSDNSLLIKFKGQKRVLTKINELKLTNSILKLNSSIQKTICYSKGHREFRFSDRGNFGASYLKEQMENNGYLLREFDLLSEAKIPSYCKIFLTLGLKEDFKPNESLALSNYLQRGGNFALLLGPDFTNKNKKVIGDLLEDNGVKASNSVVIDRLSSVHGADATVSIVDKLNAHELTKGFEGRVLFPMSLNLKNLKTKNKIITELISSSPFPASWSENDLSSLKKGVAKYSKSDLECPCSLAMAIDDPNSLSRIVIFGSEQFITNQYKGQGANFNLFLNSLEWLIGEEGIISIDRPNLSSQKLNLSTPAINLIFYFLILFMPFILLVVAFIIYKRRSHL